MTRRIPPANGQAPAAPDANIVTGQPMMPGGASGIHPDAATKINFPGVPTSFAKASPEQPEGAPEIPKVGVYVVKDCPKPAGGPVGYRVLLNGVISFFPDGKRITTTTYDVEALKRQGVKLDHLEDI